MCPRKKRNFVFLEDFTNKIYIDNILKLKHTDKDGGGLLCCAEAVPVVKFELTEEST